MRLVDADKLKISYDGHFVGVAKNDLDNAPTVEAQPVIHGHWITTGYWEDVPINKCSVCGVERRGIKRNYCANCGAKMDEASGNG